MLAPNIVLQNRYLVIRPVGQGGMGTVYEAKDTRLNARVALKETRLNDEVSLRAFEREAHILAQIRHPVLPKVIDHFTEQAGQFLVMEFIAGDDLSTLMEKRGGRFPPSAVIPWILRWADQLLDALHHLHTLKAPVYHRDIKPQNLKLSERGDIILLDFGLAKQAGGATVARGSMMGFTPNYAPLEQIRGSSPDPRSDLYSLAATLYHLATGVKPPDALTRVAALLNEQADPLRPAYEYNSYMPEAMAMLLQNTLSTNIEDRPTSAAEMRRAMQESGRERSPNLKAPPPPRPGVPLMPNDTGESTLIHRRYVSQSANTMPLQIPPEAVSSDPSTVPPVTDSDAELAPPGTLLQTFQTGNSVLAVAVNPKGRHIAVGGDDNALGIWDMQTSDLFYPMLEGHAGNISSVAFSPDGELLISGSEDKTVCLWRVRDGKLLHRSHEFSDPIESVAFSPDGQLVAIGGWGGAVFLCQIVNEALLQLTEIYTTFVHSLAFSPDSTLLAAGCYDAMIRIWEVESRRPVVDLAGHNSLVLTVAFSPDGKLLASGGAGTNIYLWRLQDGRAIDRFTGHTNFVRSVAFSSDGRTVASGSEDKTVRLWRTEDGELLHTLEGHADGVTGVAYLPSGNILASGSRDTKIRLWKST